MNKIQVIWKKYCFLVVCISDIACYKIKIYCKPYFTHDHFYFSWYIRGWSFKKKPQQSDIHNGHKQFALVHSIWGQITHTFQHASYAFHFISTYMSINAKKFKKSKTSYFFVKHWCPWRQQSQILIHYICIFIGYDVENFGVLKS